MPAREEPAISGAGSSTRRQVGVRFFSSFVISQYGDWLTTIALLVVLYDLTGNPAGPAGYILARVAPRVLGPWLGGRAADRLSPRSVLVGASVAQAILTASLVLSHRQASLWAIYSAVAVAQFAGALARPSQGAMLPALFHGRRLERANALYGLVFSTSIFVGPAIGAILLLRVGPDALFSIDAASFVVAAILAATLPSGRRDPGTSESAEPSKSKGRSSFLLGLRDPTVRMIAAANFATGATVTVTQAVLVVAARARFGNDDAVGILYSAVGIGGTIGGLLALRYFPRRSGMRLATFVSTMIGITALAGFSAATSRPVLLLLLAVSCMASATLDVWGFTEIQRRAPPRWEGRFNAIPWACQYTGMLVGALWALGTTAVVDWVLAVQLACVVMLAVAVAVWLTGRDESPRAAKKALRTRLLTGRPTSTRVPREQAVK